MKAPILNEQKETREMVDTFRGYNHNLRIGDGEFYDMKNMSSSDYPVLSPRLKRAQKTHLSETEVHGIIANDKLCFVRGKDLVVGDTVYVMNLSEDASMCPKTLVMIGANIIIIPDMMYFNTKTGKKGKIENTYTIPCATDSSTSVQSYVRFKSVPLGGGKWGSQGCSTTTWNSFTHTSVKEDGTSGDYIPATDYYDYVWCRSERKRYVKTSSGWNEVSDFDIQISILSKASGVSYPSFENFEEGKTIEIKGITGSTNDPQQNLNGEYTIIKILSSSSMILRRSMTYEEFCEEYTMGGEDEWDDINDVSQEFTIGTFMPKMDFVIESENRLWGCRYGYDSKNNFVNEIYASEQGDFRSWTKFSGTSTDSYRATIGVDGAFTGAVTYLGHPIFFKENCMHIVYGNYPSNYQIKTTMCRGVQSGCSRSIAIVNETLFYKSRSAICAYDGSLPVEVSDNLGDIAYKDAVAGSLGNKYYISMKDESDVPCMFVYDTRKGMWHKEDETYVTSFCTFKDLLYYIDDADKEIKIIGNNITSDLGSNITIEDDIEWMVETGVIGTTSPDKKYVSALNVRLCIEFGTQISFFLQYDSDGDWVNVYNAVGTNILRSFTIPIKPKRCDHFRMRIEGIGGAKIYSICKTITQGSDV